MASTSTRSARPAAAKPGPARRPITERQLTKAHVAMLSRSRAEHPARVNHLLVQLQRRYGNRHVQRVVMLARKGGGGSKAAVAGQLGLVPVRPGAAVQQAPGQLPGQPSPTSTLQQEQAIGVNPWARSEDAPRFANPWARLAPASKASVQRQTVAERRAQRAYQRFLNAGPYRFPNFAKGLNGKFDAIYNPRAKLLTINVKVKFTFPNDPPKADLSERFLQILDHARYATQFTMQVERAWSGKYRFKNVRRQQSVWQQLNPVRVKVDVIPVQTNEHFTMQAHPKTVGGAEVGGGVVKLYKGDLTPSVGAFQAATTGGEVTRLNRINPSPVRFSNNSARLWGRYRRRLDFMATYLKRINDPRFNIKITGHASATGNAADNLKLSEERAKVVEETLKTGGATNHNYTTTWKGDTGAAPHRSWRKVVIEPEIPAGWKNVFKTEVHEFGHMVGLGDEYWQSAGTAPVATHYGLVRKAFGRRYARQTAHRRGSPDTASVMHFGSDIRIHHYVTFWSALAETTRTKAAAPWPRFSYRDWKFIG